MTDLNISQVEPGPGEDTVSPADNGRNVLKSRTLKDGAIYLHVRSDYKKATWFCRIKVPGSPGYIYRSCRTTDEHAAYAFASDVYNKALARVLGGATASPKRIAPAVDSYLTHLETDQSRSSVKNKILLLKRLKPALSTKSFEDVSTSLVSGLFKTLTDLSAKERLSPNTLRRIASDLKHFFGWCVEQGYLVAIPVFPKIAGDASRRTHFDDADWRKLVRHLREFKKHENAAVRRDRSMLTDYVLILGNTGIRVGEARTLKWRDIRQVLSDDGKPNVVLTVKGKTDKREVVARTPAVKTYFGRILKLRLAEMEAKAGKPVKVDSNSLVFCHADGRPIDSFKKSFQSLIVSAGVEADSHGQKRTIYSLRHTYATFRLQQNVNQYILARNMGTSVAMLEQFYGHTTNISSAPELTKSSVKTGGPKSTSPLDWLQ